MHIYTLGKICQLKWKAIRNHFYVSKKLNASKTGAGRKRKHATYELSFLNDTSIENQVTEGNVTIEEDNTTLDSFAHDSEYYEEEFLEPDEMIETSESEVYNQTPSCSEPAVKKTCTSTPRKKYTKTIGGQLDIINNIQNAIKNISDDKPIDGEDGFGIYVADSLRKMAFKERVRVKFEVSKVLSEATYME